VKESRVLDRIKSFRKINGGQISSVWRSFLLEAVANILGQEKCGPTRSKVGLGRRDLIFGL